MTRVLIVDDHPIFRDGLAGLLATVPEVEVVGTAGNAEEALTALQANQPDVVLMDINLPGASGVEATRRASQVAPSTAVLMVTMVDDDDSVFAALAAGARGYVLKGASGDESPRRCARSPPAVRCSARGSPAGCWPGRRRDPPAQPRQPTTS
jgi:DNA-binding NarL/FixJ family response regulator